MHDISWQLLSEENKNVLCHAIPDPLPVTEDHRHTIPENHVPDFFDSQELEPDTIFVLLEKKEDIWLLDNAVSEFNVGFKLALTAGKPGRTAIRI